MKIRSTVTLGEHSFQSLLVPVMQETDDHLILKLAAQVLFHPSEPIPSPSLQHPALQGQDFVPDLMHVNDHNEITLWIECGKTTPHKIEKVSKRYRQARLVMLTENPREAQQMLKDVREESWNRLECLAFPEGEFSRLRESVSENNQIIGEATETELNLVINDQLFVCDLQKIS